MTVLPEKLSNVRSWGGGRPPPSLCTYTFQGQNQLPRWKTVLSDRRAITLKLSPSESFCESIPGLWPHCLCTRELLNVLLQGHVISLVHSTLSVLLGTFCVKSYQGPWLEKPCRRHKEDRASHDTRVQMHYEKKTKLLSFSHSMYIQETEWRWPIVTPYPAYTASDCYSFHGQKEKQTHPKYSSLFSGENTSHLL